MYKNRYLITFILIIIGSCFCIKVLGRIIEKKLGSYVEGEVSRVSMILIRNVLDSKFINRLDLDDLYYIEKTNSGDIELIDFNTAKINEILGIVNNQVIKFFDSFERGEVNLLYEAKLFERMNKGIMLEVPMGVILNNPILNNVGPKIPIKVAFNGNVESNVNTKIKQYGINNILLEIDVEIVVVESIILPFSRSDVKILFDFPLVIEIISGKVPENYLKS